MARLQQRDGFAKFTLYVLLFNILVILWGGLVSASGSGDGCGASWPLCADAAERTASGLATFIELFHRLTSGLALFAVGIQTIWAFRAYPERHPVRFGALGSMLFMLGEAAIGALIVLFGLVADNNNLARAFTQPLHLINTYLLLAFLALTVFWAYGGGKLQLRTHKRLAGLMGIGLFGLLLLSSFGTVASLASTIFPSETFLAGVQKDFASNAHYLIRLRILHPILATLVGAYLFWLMQWVSVNSEQWTVNSKQPTIILGLFITQYLLGVLNAVLLTPIWIQLTHLLLSDLIWLSLIWLSATVLTETAPSLTLSSLASSRLGVSPSSSK